MASDRYGYFLTVIAAAVLAEALARVSSRRARACAAVVALSVIGILSGLTWSQLDVWSGDQAQHRYVAAHLTNPELLDDFTSRLLTLEFLRGNEKEASDAVYARLRIDPSSEGYRRAAAIFADKRRLGDFYGRASYLAILHYQLGSHFARLGELREANDHFEEALRQDDRLYQAAYDRALVLLRLGSCERGLRSYLWSEGWAPSGLPLAQRREFLYRLEGEAAAENLPLLVHAARAALAR
jgi:tetratricopeptide (TPR) repeat protein